MKLLRIRHPLVIAVVLLSSVLARAQDVTAIVSSVSDRQAATAAAADKPSEAVVPPLYLDGHDVTVADGKQIMIYLSSEAGRAVIIAQGPARFAVQYDDEGILDIRVASGRFTASSRDATEAFAARLQAVDGDKVLLSGPIPQGWLYLARDGDVVTTAFDSESPAAAAPVLLVGEKEVELPSGQRLTVRSGEGVATPIDDAWRSQASFQSQQWNRGIGMAAARLTGAAVQGQLFDSIVEWDQSAGTAVVKKRLEVAQFRPEIRQVSVSVNAPVSATGNSGQAPQTPNVVGANQVPLVSPASVSVGGVTAAASLNSNAANVLQQTGSRGLGFNGLRQLAVPGSVNGIRTVGPSGLGAR